MKGEEKDRLIAMLPPDTRPVVDLMVRLYEDQLAQRDQLIADMEARIRELAAQVNQNSRNSSRPPSSDGPKKPPKAPRSQGKTKKRPPGGQKGHPGRTLKMVSSEEATIQDHYPRACGVCGEDLNNQAPLDYERRQVFDIPPFDIEITEHRAHYKQCPCCAHQTQAAFPAEATNHAVYGPNIRTTVSYLMVYQMLPYERTARLLSDLFGIELSQGTLDNILQDANSGLAMFADQLRECLQHADVVGFDETTIRAEDAQRYAHVARSEQHTLFHLGRRDYETMNQMGVLPAFTGVAVHDRYANYFGYDCQHSLCNAHLLRDLQGVIEHYADDWPKRQWAEELQQLLRKINQATKRAKEQGKTGFSTQHQSHYRQRFRYWVEQGLKNHPEVPPPERGAPPSKQSKAHNLLIALDQYTDEALHFLYNFNVPFDNNGAERDIRMLKVKMKISGFFHSLTTGNRFLRIRSFISTAEKQGWTAFHALRQLFDSQQKAFVLNLVRL